MISDSEKPAPVDTSVYHCCDMYTLARLIRQWDTLALETWRQRYGHEYPVYAIIRGEELRSTD